MCLKTRHHFRRFSFSICWCTGCLPGRPQSKPLPFRFLWLPALYAKQLLWKARCLLMNQNRHSKHQKMTAVREAGFCMIDAGMYLDTHPCDGKAMDYFNRYQQMYKEAVCDYEKHCGPLFLTGIDTNDGWTWTDEPWPWEGGCS